MKPDELLRQIEQRRIAPVYFLSGDDEFSKEEVVQRLITTAIEPGAEAFSLDLLNGETADAPTILTLSATVPMLSERRIVVVRAFQRLSQGDREAVVDYAEHPSPTTCLVLITPRVDQKTKLYARLSRAATAVIFYPMDPERDLSRILAWLKQRAGLSQKRISPEACQALLGVVGADLRELAGELDKLVVYVGSRQTIDATDVEAVIGPSRVGTVFDLAQAIGEKDLAQAHRTLSRALDAGEAPHALVAILIRHLTILWKIRLLKQEKKSDDETKKVLKLGWGFNQHFKKYLTQAQLLSRKDLQTGFEALLQADLALKTSTQSHRLIMQRLLYELCVQ